MEFLLLIACLVVLLVLGMPLFYALGAATLVFLAATSPEFVNILPQRIWAGANTYVMIALPLFIMAGELMSRGGITKRILDLSLLLVRPFRGGLGEVTVVSSMIFGGISGSSVSDASAIGSALIPQMVKKGYDNVFATGLVVAASTMGMIIPPSIPMILYSTVSGDSIDQLFLAGLIPGVLIGIAQIFIVRYFAPAWQTTGAGGMNMGELLTAAKGGILAIMMPVVIVVSIAFGIATATESAAIAVLYALILGFFVYRELKIADLAGILERTVLASSSVMIIIAYSMIFTWVLAMGNVTEKLGQFLLQLDLNHYLLLLFIDVFILAVGFFIDVGPALLLFCPVLVPIMVKLGVSSLQFGAIMIVGLAMGLVTPPVGMCLNAGAKISGLPITTIFRGALPFLVSNLVILLLVTFVPEVSLWLPGLFARK